MLLSYALIQDPELFSSTAWGDDIKARSIFEPPAGKKTDEKDWMQIGAVSDQLTIRLEWMAA